MLNYAMFPNHVLLAFDKKQPSFRAGPSGGFTDKVQALLAALSSAGFECIFTMTVNKVTPGGLKSAGTFLGLTQSLLFVSTWEQRCSQPDVLPAPHPKTP